MLQLRHGFAAIALGTAAAPSEPPPTTVARGQIQFDERVWGRGSLPSLTFSVTGGRGVPEKVTAFLYYSEEPEAFLTSPFPPQFVGVLEVPSSIQVLVDHPPERGPINEHSREKFVQGAIFDVRTGALADVTNEEYLDVSYEAAPFVFDLDFGTQDDFLSPLANGQDLSTPPEFGSLFSLSALQPQSGPPHFGPAVFDSTPSGPNALSSDPDLLVDSGNILILQENGVQTVSGIFDKPDDSANGGTLVFDFTGFDFIEKVEPLSLDLIDIDLGSPRDTLVVLTDVLGRTRSFRVPPGWTEDITRDGPFGIRTLDLTTLDPQPGFLGTATASEAFAYIPAEVVRMEVTIGGSGAVDNLVFAREQDPDAFTGRGRRTGTRSGTSGTKGSGSGR
jgi:hypothetical protein